MLRPRPRESRTDAVSRWRATVPLRVDVESETGRWRWKTAISALTATSLDLPSSIRRTAKTVCLGRSPYNLILTDRTIYCGSRRTRVRIMAGTREPRPDVAAGLPVKRSPTMPHDDLRVQLEVVEPRGRYNPRLRTGADGGDQENSEYQGGNVSSSLLDNEIRTDEVNSCSNSLFSLSHTASEGLFWPM